MSTDEGKACYRGYPDESHNILIGFPGLPVVKNSPAKQEMQKTQFQFLGREDSLERKWQPTLVFSPRKSHGQRSLAGYSSNGRKELDITEHEHN